MQALGLLGDTNDSFTTCILTDFPCLEIIRRLSV